MLLEEGEGLQPRAVTSAAQVAGEGSVEGVAGRCGRQDAGDGIRSCEEHQRVASDRLNSRGGSMSRCRWFRSRSIASVSSFDIVEVSRSLG